MWGTGVRRRKSLNRKSRSPAGAISHYRRPERLSRRPRRALVAYQSDAWVATAEPGRGIPPDLLPAQGRRCPCPGKSFAVITGLTANPRQTVFGKYCRVQIDN